MADAACKGLPTAIFFSADSAGAAAAGRVCEGCAVRDLCLEYALANHFDHGVWGGSAPRRTTTNAA
jgi:WhiB family redox-sensing transcriptional regulator